MPLFDGRLRALQRAQVFQQHVAQRDLHVFEIEAAACRLHLRVVDARFEHRLVVRDGAEVIGLAVVRAQREIELGEHDVDVEQPVVVARPVHAHRQVFLVELVRRAAHAGAQGRRGDGLGARRGGQRFLGRFAACGHRVRIAVDRLRVARNREAAMEFAALRVERRHAAAVVGVDGVRYRVAVHVSHVIGLLERVECQLPVAVDDRRPREAGGQLVERIALDAAVHGLHELGEAQGRRRIDVDEDEALPHVAGDAAQAELALVEVEERGFVGHAGELAVEVVGPAMELARELAGAATRLVHDLVHAMRAHVVHRIDLALLVANHDDRGVAGRQLLDEPVARRGNLLDAADMEPGLLEDVLFFFLVVRGRDIRIHGHRPEAEFRIPARKSRLVDWFHALPQKLTAFWYWAYPASSGIAAGRPLISWVALGVCPMKTLPPRSCAPFLRSGAKI